MWFYSLSNSEIPLEIKFYLVSLLFIVFDVEIIFLFPLSLSSIAYSFNDIFFITLFIHLCFWVFFMK